MPIRFARAITAMRMLALREHSATELEQKLCGKGHANGVVAQVLEELQRLDLQSDDRFVDSFFRGRLTKGHGPVRIRHDLIRKGIDETLVEATLTQQAEFWIELAELARAQALRRSVAGGRQLSLDITSPVSRPAFLGSIYGSWLSVLAPST